MNTAAAVFLIFLICFGCLIAFGILISEYLDLRSELGESQSIFQREEQENNALQATVTIVEDGLRVCEVENDDLEHQIERLQGENEILMAQLTQNRIYQENLASEYRRVKEQLNRSSRILSQYYIVVNWAGEHLFEILSLPASLGLVALTTAGLARRRLPRN